MLNTLQFSNLIISHRSMPPAKDIDQRTMRGSCWNPTEPVAFASQSEQQQQQQQLQQQQRLAAKEESQKSALSAATPAWGLDNVANNSTVEDTRTTPNSPSENSTLSQTNYGNYDYRSQDLQSTLSNYSPESITIKSEPQEHPGYDSGRDTLNDPEDDDMIEMSPEVLVQTEMGTKDISNAVKQTPKRQITRKMLKCPMCAFESDNTNRENFMDHLVTHCAMANRGPLIIPSSARNDDEQPPEDEIENEGVVDDDTNLRMPQITAQGTVKFYRCKKCKAPSLTKYDSWIHQREHMTPEKILYCKVCPFATEYKHHLEYHMRNHYGSKPFKCNKCNYTCVNKSMLNSHLKSHSSIYQYRCASCSYVTKYCHSLKVHLKRNMHQPAVVLNPDGTPNPNPIIDVNSTRRGPRTKPQTGTGSCSASDNYANSAQSKSHEGSPEYEGQIAPVSMYSEINYNQFADTKQTKKVYVDSQLPESSFYSGSVHDNIVEQTYAQNSLLQNNLSLMANNSEQFADFQKNLAVLGYMKMIQELREHTQNKATEVPKEQKSEIPSSEPLDLSNKSDSNSVDEYSPAKRRRKGIAMRLDQNNQSLMDSDNESRETIRFEIENLNNNDDSKGNGMERQSRITVYKNGVKQHMFVCRICDIIFQNEVMFTIHMGYHGRQDPLTCQVCGVTCPNHLAFFVHVTHTEH